MSQIIVGQNANGIVLAGENRAIQLDEKGDPFSIQINRLIALTSHCALLISGAAEGRDMASALKDFLAGEKLSDIQDIYRTTLPYLLTEYERFMRRQCERLPVDPTQQVSFILAGKTDKDRQMPFRLYYIWTKRKLPQLDGEEISHAFSLPRRMGLEFQLNKMCKENASLKEILRKMADGIEQLRRKEEVSGPVSFATITQEGFQSVNP